MFSHDRHAFIEGGIGAELHWIGGHDFGNEGGFGGELLGQTQVHGEPHKTTTITLPALDSGTLPRPKQQLVTVTATRDLAW